MKYAPRKVYIKERGRYVELSYTDFCCRRESDQTYMDKLFIPVQGCLLEVVREQYTDFYRDKERWRYLQKLDTKNSLLSLDGFTDSEGNPLDFIADEAADIAETVVNAVMVDRLKAALPLLSDSEQDKSFCHWHPDYAISMNQPTGPLLAHSLMYIWIVSTKSMQWHQKYDL